MKKFTLITVVLAFALGALILPASAQQAPQADFTTLAQYFPEKALIYTGFRTDDDMLQTLDSLATRIGSAVPGGLMQGSIQEALDEAASNFKQGGTFADTIRPWLGDTGAFGISSLPTGGGSAAYALAITITDQDKAEALFDSILTSDQYSVKDGTGFSEYVPKSEYDTTYFVFRSDVLLATTDKALADAGGAISGAKLSDNANFTDTLGLLPETQYDGVAYIDTPSLLSTAMAFSSVTGESTPGMSAAMSMLSGLKPQVMGLTLLDNRALTLDVVTPVNANASGTLTMSMGHHPVDPAFAQHIPANTPLVVEGNDLYNTYQAAITNMQTMANSVPSGNLNSQDLATGLWGLGFVVRGLTGMEVSDALGWMTGDYAMSVGFSPAFTDAKDFDAAMQSMPVDFGVVIAETDQTAAQKFFDGLNRSLVGLPAKQVTVKQETLDGGVQALTFTITTPDIPFPLEIVAASGNGVLAVGTRHMVLAALNPQNNGLSGDSSFTEASKYLLKDTSTLLFLSGSSLEPLVKVMTALSSPSDIRQQGKQIQTLLHILSSVSLSESTLPDNGGTLARFVWTLPQ